MFIADTLLANNYDVQKYNASLKALSLFAYGIIDDQNKLQDIVSTDQKRVSKGKLIWLLPYSHMMKSTDLLKKAYKKNLVSTNYSQLGGELRVFYKVKRDD